MSNPYITSIERRGIEKGEIIGLEKGERVGIQRERMLLYRQARCRFDRGIADRLLEVLTTIVEPDSTDNGEEI